jgi:AmmeMemoRadiSam system protein B/AmmeMemoRadiSam system protein A
LAVARAADVRPVVAAGRFYPADPTALRAAVDGFLADAIAREEVRGDRPLALIAPHAGYVFSGQIAADAWSLASPYTYDLIVLLGTNHTTAGFRGISVFAGDGYRTPLGITSIDTEAADFLRAADPAFTYRADVHAREHSVEVQVPFAQVVFPDVPIVAAVIGVPDPDLCERFGAALAELAQRRRLLIVASSDLSHYPSYEDAERVDRTVLEHGFLGGAGALLATVRREEASDTPELATCACGLGPILTALAAAERERPNRRVLISYANSGDTALGELARVVGYGAAAILDGAGPNVPLPTRRADGELTQTSEQNLLAFARKSIRRYLVAGTTPLARDLGPGTDRRRGAFVTLRRDGDLRGCIGHMVADRPLGEVVGAMAVQAAFNDRRFTPVTGGELDQLEIEISVLTPYQPVSGPQAIRVGTDGVVLRKGDRSAVFLPQVATEQGWNREQLLSALARKAGLPADAWREGAQLSTFQAHVFAESAAQ